MQNRSKTLLAIAMLVAISLYTQSALAQAGKLDSSFGQGGKVITSFGNLVPGGQVDGVPFAALQQSDGKIVVVGQIGVLPNLATEAIGLVRYLPNGSLDLTFGNGGVALTAFDNFISYGYSLALMPDGRIVVAGEEQSNDGTFDRFGVARFNPNGTLDRTLGGTGMVTTELFAAPQPGVREAAFAVIVQTDGKIVAGGSARNGGRFQPTFTALARYNLDGSLDTTFGNGGKVMTTAVPGPAQSLALLSNGHILAAAGTKSAEFSANGVLQNTVVGGAITTTSRGGSETFEADDKFLQIQSFAVTLRTHIIEVVKFEAAGGVDSSFNNPPFNYGGSTGSGGGANAIVMQADGKSVVGGATAGLFGIARLNEDGSLDQTFGASGTVTTAFPSTAGVSAITMQSDGKVVAVGIVLDSTTGIASFALARYLGQ